MIKSTSNCFHHKFRKCLGFMPQDLLMYKIKRSKLCTGVSVSFEVG